MEFYDLILEKALEEGIQKIVVGAIIKNEQRKILILTRKTDDFMGGIDELPSGTKELGENLYNSLVREVKEETNLDLIKVISYINSFDYLSGSGKKTRQFNFEIKVYSTDNVILTEHSEYKWSTSEECLKNPKLTDEVKYIINIVKFNNNQKEEVL